MAKDDDVMTRQMAVSQAIQYYNLQQNATVALTLDDFMATVDRIGKYLDKGKINVGGGGA